MSDNALVAIKEDVGTNSEKVERFSRSIAKPEEA